MKKKLIYSIPIHILLLPCKMLGMLPHIYGMNAWFILGNVLSFNLYSKQIIHFYMEMDDVRNWCIQLCEDFLSVRSAGLATLPAGPVLPDPKTEGTGPQVSAVDNPKWDLRCWKSSFSKVTGGR